MAKRKKNYLGKVFGYIGESKKYIYAITILFLISSLMGFIFSSSLGFLDELLNEIVEKVGGLSAGQLPLFIFQNNLSSAFFSMLFGIFLGITPLLNALSNGVILGYVFAKAFTIGGFWVILKLLPHGIFELPAIIIALGMGLRLGAGFLENFFFYYRKNPQRRFFGIIAIMVSLAGFLFFAMAFSGFISPENGLLVSAFVSFGLGVLFILPLVNILFGEPKLRKIQRDVFAYRFNQAMRVFIFVVLPLLALAAIIEGVLIALYVF